MKKNIYYLVFFVSLFVFSSCEDDTVRETTYKGTIVNAIDHKPFPNLEVSVTNGESTYKTVHTDFSGFFSVLVRSNEINSSYYLLVGDSSCAPVKKELKGLGREEMDLGVIEVEGPKAPVVTTDTVYSHKAGTVVCRGTVVDAGRASISERGICWSTKENPTVSDEKKPSDTNGEGEYEINIGDLKLGTTYYFKAYAKNRIDISYGKQIEFKTGDGKASVETDSVFAVTATSAKCAGNVTGDGDYAITKRGVCWALTSDPEIADFVAYDENPGVGPFVCSMRNLTPSTQYYVRAFVINESNSNATTYGEVKPFITRDGKPTVSTGTPSATANTITIIGSTIVENGGYAIEDKGICYSTSSTEPTTAGQKVSSGKGDGSFDVTINNLDAHTTYYLRAYAINEKGTSYGEYIPVQTSSGKATIELGKVSNITVSSAKCTVKITNDGGATVQSCGICWSTNPSPTISGEKSMAGGKQLNTEYLCSMSGLEHNTTYYIRAYVTTNISTEYSVPSTFKTTSGKPTVTTSTNSEAGENYLIITGSRDTEEYAPITRQGICWSTIDNPTISNNVVEATSVTANPFSCKIEGLESGTTYYCRAFAITSYDIGYGQSYPFTTAYAPAKIKGYVRDQDGFPVAGVSIAGNRLTPTTTDQNGYYEISINLTSRKTYNLSATKSGYKEETQSVSVNPAEVVQVDYTINLEKTCDVDLGNGQWVDGPAKMIFECHQKSLAGKTTTRNMRLKNYRPVPVTWQLSNLPSQGVQLSQTSGTIPANGEISVVVTLTYPSTNAQLINLTGCSSGNKTYVWNWEAAVGGVYMHDAGYGNYYIYQDPCAACCEQGVYIYIGDEQGSFHMTFNQFAIF